MAPLTEPRPAPLIAGMRNDFLIPGSGRLYNPSARDYFLRVIAEATAGWDVVAYQTALIGLGRLQPDVVISFDQAVGEFLGLSAEEPNR